MLGLGKEDEQVALQLRERRLARRFDEITLPIPSDIAAEVGCRALPCKRAWEHLGGPSGGDTCGVLFAALGPDATGREAVQVVSQRLNWGMVVFAGDAPRQCRWDLAKGLLERRGWQVRL